MDYMYLIYVLSIYLTISSVLMNAQQPYIRKAATSCHSTDNSTSVVGYTCNGLTPSCQAYLTFRSLPPYVSVSSISTLLAADPSQLSLLNSVTENATFQPNQMVLVPVNCSCSGGMFYQVNTSYVVERDDNFFTIANNTFQGLTTCRAIQDQNSHLDAQNLYSGMRLTVPLRCACPSKNQSDAGVKYLLSYLITWGEYVDLISHLFGVDTATTLDANELSEQDDVVYPFTTLLIPLENPPSSSPFQTSSLPPPPLSFGPSSKKSSHNKTWVYVVAGVLGGLALILGIGAVVFYMFFSTSNKKFDPTLDSESFEAEAHEKPSETILEESQFFDSLSSTAQSLKIYKIKELEAATDNFSPSCLIKGSVYRSTINGDLAAIKKINVDVSNEISLLNKINHFNLIRLSGVSFSDGNWYLVYEYAVNGPLSDHMYTYNVGDQSFLTWTQRIQIALDVATGLNYLHSYASPPCVHMDIRSSNVLLDSDYRAKIANFSSARSADGEEGQFVLTKHIVGTKGYMAPEYLEHGLISTKLDVYSFGILMLELLTGKEIALMYEGVNTDLSNVLVPILHEKDVENLSNFVDPHLRGNFPAKLAMSMINLVDICIKKTPLDRPNMDEIVHNLSKAMNISLSWEMSSSTSEYISLS